MKLIVLGAAGRMGQNLVRVIEQTPGATLCAAIERAGSPILGRDAGEVAGVGTIGVDVTDDLTPFLVDADGILDFTAPANSVAVAEHAREHGLVHIVGTTGFSAQEEAEIARCGEAGARIVKSGNMSLGVNLLALLVERAAKALSAENFDIEVVEMHHRHKVDAPSGTALLLGEAAAAGREVDLPSASVRVRDGHTGPRSTGTIGFATLRGGSVIGDHTVVYAGEGERVELTHRADDRSIYARGAVKAALWAKDQSAGYYSMRDVLGL
ncbi:4-hydroxy-tetrahydrodipicolinate reductase [Aureimonas fodinaquatilis]|uniref:4-hydroxy-tetrahydrodipicolinate reductase n=1 Tax=Aureimonas fodinaquatilis TaxID=2565783 RepID=A0A5B0E2Q9_9HYPH|nr:4-hydroxy-tetrahydrodipicolinate reductase [Aureimonas fodinaquatilis]KAA0971709.1 4-hydroxy-tetrahydrodipicolinate reductase [Aureimonas fodinaquatilis]